jgi:hypothetical protein
LRPRDFVVLVDVSDPVELEPIELLPEERPLADVSALVVDGFGIELVLDEPELLDMPDVPVAVDVPALEL